MEKVFERFYNLEEEKNTFENKIEAKSISFNYEKT